MYDEALKAAIESIEHCINARRQAPEGNKPRLSKKCEQLMRKAECIKMLQRKAADRARYGLHDGLTAPSPTGISQQSVLGVVRDIPVSTKKLTIKEETLLWKSSKINGHTFPPWESDPKPSEF